MEKCDQLKLCYTSDPLNQSNADVLFYGFRQIDENPIFYALADAFVLPSIYEEWGLVVNEAMACGVPVLVSNTVGSAEDLVAEGVNGFCFDPRSSDQLAEHLLKLHDDPELRNQMGEASANKIKEWGCENFANKASLIADLVREHKIN
jgi:glycosyltransferase involved in cell wall biosynthesis